VWLLVPRRPSRKPGSAKPIPTVQRQVRALVCQLQQLTRAVHPPIFVVPKMPCSHKVQARKYSRTLRIESKARALPARTYFATCRLHTSVLFLCVVPVL
jgi:hypothetical protein